MDKQETVCVVASRRSSVWLTAAPTWLPSWLCLDRRKLAGPEQLGFVYDVGHAQALARLGFYPHEEWLQRYSARIIGAHLHDAIGITDHLAPGLGEVDFDMAAAYLPEEAFRTCEFKSTNTAGQVKAGLEFLVEHGCIKCL